MTQYLTATRDCRGTVARAIFFRVKPLKTTIFLQFIVRTAAPMLHNGFHECMYAA